VPPAMILARGVLAAWLLLVPVAGVSPGESPAPARYRVEQVFRLETTTARPQGEPATTAVEGRVRLVLEQRLQPGNPLRGVWRFAEVEVEGPRSEPAEAKDARTERALALGLAWMKQLEGKEFTGPLADLPVLPLGEARPAWLTAWLRWAQTGGFSGREGNPVPWTSAVETEGTPPDPAVAYELRWLRSEFRQAPCHVQQARWTLPVGPAPGSVTPDLAADGVEARTHFSALSLEWVSQDNPALVYAERSGVRETFWNLEKVKKPELRELVFRLRFSVKVRVERLP